MNQLKLEPTSSAGFTSNNMRGVLRNGFKYCSSGRSWIALGLLYCFIFKTEAFLACPLCNTYILNKDTQIHRQ